MYSSNETYLDTDSLAYRFPCKNFCFCFFIFILVRLWSSAERKREEKKEHKIEFWFTICIFANSGFVQSISWNQVVCTSAIIGVAGVAYSLAVALLAILVQFVNMEAMFYLCAEFSISFSFQS